MPATDRADGGQLRQCRRVGSADVELHAAMALADMAGVEHHALPSAQHHHAAAAAALPQVIDFCISIYPALGFQARN
jgi:hypothetical protein